MLSVEFFEGRSLCFLGPQLSLSSLRDTLATHDRGSIKKNPNEDLSMSYSSLTRVGMWDGSFQEEICVLKVSGKFEERIYNG